MVFLKAGHSTDLYSDTVRPFLHCHAHHKKLYKLLAAYTAEPMQPAVAKERVLKQNNDK